ncbi:MAG: hypothetical protein GY866_24355 [Proteobacteria bacterium]|nr:hypothetical protein [Pseudomonadota bacterium]
MQPFSFLRIVTVIFLVCSFFTVQTPFSTTNVAGQTGAPGNLLGQLEDIGGRIEQDIVLGNLQIDKGNYGEAEKLTNRVLGNLNILVEVFIPLQERIRKLLKNERDILDNTHRLQNRPHQDVANTGRDQQNLIDHQIRNRDETEKTVQITEQQRQSLTEKNDPSGRNQTKTPANEGQVELLKRIQELLKDARTHQDSAVEFLDESRFEEAVKVEKQSIEKLEEALKEFQGTQNEKKQSQKQDKQSQKQDGQSQNRKNPPQDGREQAERKKPSDSSKKEQMTPQAALKELSRLRKKANDEKKRREKKYGKISTHDSIPVEKDW